MSLDVYLTMPGLQQAYPHDVIYIREAGSKQSITRAEWDARFPGRAPVIVMRPADATTEKIYEANITHNLVRMAQAAGLYGIVWEPEMCSITNAHELTEPLRIGLDVLRQDPAYFQRFNPANGWGTYELLVRFAQQYLNACRLYPQAQVSVSR